MTKTLLLMGVLCMSVALCMSIAVSASAATCKKLQDEWQTQISLAHDTHTAPGIKKLATIKIQIAALRLSLKKCTVPNGSANSDARLLSIQIMIWGILTVRCQAETLGIKENLAVVIQHRLKTSKNSAAQRADDRTIHSLNVASNALLTANCEH